MGDTEKPVGKPKLTSAEKKARAQARRAEWKTRLREREAAWKAQVAAHFSYLETEYGFHLAKVDASWGWETYALYRSSFLAVKVSRNVEFDCAELWLIRLVDGQIPEYPIFINPDTPINYVILDRVVDERAPSEAEKFNTLRGLSDKQVERTLVFLAASLRAYGDDALHGDFAIFSVIADKLHQNAREHPQEIKVWLPDTAQPGEERPLVENLQKTYPQQPIVIGRYSTQKRAKIRNGEKRVRATQPAPASEQPSKPSEPS